MNKINSLRQGKDLTLKELADFLGVSEATVSRWENGKSDIRGKNLKKLSDFFNVSESYLLGYLPVDYQKILSVGLDDISDVSKQIAHQANTLSPTSQKMLLDIADYLAILEDESVNKIEKPKNTSQPPF